MTVTRLVQNRKIKYQSYPCSADLSFALQCCSVLKLSVIIDPAGTGPAAGGTLPGLVVQELRDIRNRITQLLDNVCSAQPDVKVPIG